MPTPPSDRELALWLADALDPGQGAELQAQIDADPALQQRLSALSLPVDTGDGAGGGWRIPPPGLGWRTRTAVPAVMGTERIRVGDHFPVHVARPDAPDQMGVIVLREEAGHWAVLSPESPQQVVTLDRCARRVDEELVVDLVARRPLGRQRWAIALMPVPLPQGEAGDPWGPVRDALAQGAIAVGSIEIEVVER